MAVTTATATEMVTAVNNHSNSDSGSRGNDNNEGGSGSNGGKKYPFITSGMKESIPSADHSRTLLYYGDAVGMRGYLANAQYVHRLCLHIFSGWHGPRLMGRKQGRLQNGGANDDQHCSEHNWAVLLNEGCALSKTDVHPLFGEKDT
jgi:hypothetical protein